jgi:hypothetical protein
MPAIPEEDPILSSKLPDGHPNGHEILRKVLKAAEIMKTNTTKTLIKDVQKVKRYVHLREGDDTYCTDGFRRFETKRANQVDAALVYMLGDRQKQPCKTCAKGNGPFEGCYRIQSAFNGSCANCHYSSGSHVCTLRTDQKAKSLIKTKTGLKRAAPRAGSPEQTPKKLKSAYMPMESKGEVFRSISRMHSRMADMYGNLADLFEADEAEEIVEVSDDE